MSKSFKKIKFHRKNKTKKNNFNKNELNSNDGMLTTVWGPSLWHYLHIMSFNYPNNPTNQQKTKYMEFIKNLQYTLPCKYCRINLNKNFKVMPLTKKVMKNRFTFSKYVYDLHESVNKMLNKKSNLSYEIVRQRYENFRARCTNKNIKQRTFNLKIVKQKRKTQKKKEKGCTTPYYGKKSKCVIKIVPQDTKCDTFQMDNKCYRSMINN